MEDDILWIMLIISLFVFVMALWKWKVGVGVLLSQALQHREGDWWGPGPSPRLGWGPCLGGEAGSQQDLARLGQESQGRQGPGPGCALGWWMLPSHSLLSVPI